MILVLIEVALALLSVVLVVTGSTAFIIPLTAACFLAGRAYQEAR